ncbi:HAD family hydrolase [Nocardia stercoris]|uniref:HAD family hydrolase n=1 Tax=Nocardia stercoris TaxID=2483361 RepID=UPI001F2D783D|nr:HAD-IIB family hydrolase [Nocardia stercoris]
MAITVGAPQLIALDVDGTLLETGASVSPRVRAAVLAAAASGAHVVIATGRTLVATRQVVGELGLSAGHVICSNGAVRADLATWAPLDVHTFDPKAAAVVLRSLFPEMVLAVEKVGVGVWATDFFPGSIRGGEFHLVTDEQLVAEPTARLSGWWPAGDLDQMIARMAEVDLPDAGWIQGDNEPWLVATKPGVSKSAALERLRRQLGVPREATLAIGDGYNDVDMIEWAARSVAMGNAVPEVKAAADEVTAEVSADGVAQVLERWFTP